MSGFGTRIPSIVTGTPKLTTLCSREPIGHREIVSLLNESFDELGSDAIMPLLEEYKEPLYGSMERAFSAYKNKTEKLDPAKLRQMIVKRNQLQKNFLDRWMATRTDSGGPIDAIIAPVAPSGAPRLGQGEAVDYIGYTGFVNLLGKRRTWDLPFFS